MIAAKNRCSTPIATKMDVAESKRQPFSAAINLIGDVIIGSGDGKKYRERYAVAPNSVIRYISKSKTKNEKRSF